MSNIRLRKRSHENVNLGKAKRLLDIVCFYLQAKLSSTAGIRVQSAFAPHKTHTYIHTQRHMRGACTDITQQHPKAHIEKEQLPAINTAIATHLSGGKGEKHEDHAVEVGGRGAARHEKVHAEGSVAQVLRGVPCER